MMAVSQVTRIFEDVRREGRTELTEPEAKQVLAGAGLTITREELASTEDEAVASAERIGFPVVLKIASPDILHKSEAGAIRLDLQTEEAVIRSYDEIIESSQAYNSTARINGVLVQEMIGEGTEVIIGMSQDPQFGPTIAFGFIAAGCAPVGIGCRANGQGDKRLSDPSRCSWKEARGCCGNR